MKKQKINKLTDTRIEVVTTVEDIQEYEQATLEHMKVVCQEEMDRIDALLAHF